MLKKLIVFFILAISFQTLIAQRVPLPECKFKGIAEKSFFFNVDTLGNYNKRKAYLTKGDVVWTICKYSDDEYVFIKFKNKQKKITTGYIKREELEELDL